MNDDFTKFCTFEAAGRLFGIPLPDIKEVTAEINCTRIPHAPACVRGFVNIRGQILLGLDLKELLNLPGKDECHAKRLVIFKSSVGPSFGLLVDEIGEIESVLNSDLLVNDFVISDLSIPSPSGIIDSVCRLHSRLLVVLNPRNFLPLVENELSKTRPL